MKTLTIRVQDDEHALMQAIAAKRFMSITAMVRAHFHSLAEEDADMQSGQRSKRVARIPIPQGQNALRDAIYERINKGETPAAVAESYGMQAADVKAMHKRAKENAEAYYEPSPELSVERITKDVLNDPEQLKKINDAKFAEIMANLDGGA